MKKIDINQISLEIVFEELENIVRKMDEEELPLEEAFELYQYGMQLVSACHSKIEKVEQELIVINEERGLIDSEF